ncbi:MAG TPA: hypothetical protein DIT64_10985 [Verrucomicrobiales bacterium]|nr:hypothetical protein [Verrucomicrobiales bacterium]
MAPKGRSVPALRVTRYCSSVRRFFHSSSVRVTSGLGMGFSEVEFFSSAQAACRRRARVIRTGRRFFIANIITNQIPPCLPRTWECRSDFFSDSAQVRLGPRICVVKGGKSPPEKFKHHHSSTPMKTIIHHLRHSSARILCGSLLALSLTGIPAVAQIGGVKVSTTTLITQQQADSISSRFSTTPDFAPAERNSRPTLVLLIHGGTSAPNSPLPFVEPEDDEKRPGTVGYSRFYFDFPFVSGILGSTRLYTLRGEELDSANWKSEFLSSERSDQFALANDPSNTASRATTNAVGLVRLDGSRGIGEMSRTALREIRALVDEFARHSNRRPFVVLVGHSKGGLVTRYLMSEPQGNVAGINLTADERSAIRRLRNQVRYCVTISSPHTGSPLPDYAIEFRESSAAVVQGMVQAAWNTVRAAAATRGIPLPAASPVNVTTDIIRLMGNPDDLGHLTTQFWNTMNNGPLHPSRMVRDDGTRIPFFLYGGRTPGAEFFATANMLGLGGPALNTLLPSHPQSQVNHMTQALIGLDYALHNVVGGDWGRIRLAGAASKNLDIVRRAWPVFGIPNRMSNPGERVFLLGVEGAPTYYLRNQGDNETDSDGMVSMDSALGIGLFTGPSTIENLQVLNVPVPATVMEPWERNVRSPAPGQAAANAPLGSWYRMYSGPWNMQNHTTIVKRRELGVELNRLLRIAGPLASATSGTTSIWPAR